MIMNEGERLIKVVVCAPVKEYFDVVDPRAHNITKTADKRRAIEQHDHLCSILQDNGVEVLCIPELKDHPNSVFTRDTCVCTSQGFIQMRMGLSSRQGEEVWMAEILKETGMEQHGGIRDPGTLEGGDVILAGDVVFVGRSKRSNSDGVDQLRRLFEEIDREVRIADVPQPRLHIGGMMSMIGPRRILCCQDLFPGDFFKGFPTIPVPAENFVSGNVICLGENKVIAEKSNTTAIDCLEKAGVYVHAIDLSEFIKGRGGPTCLLMPVKRAHG